MVTDATGTSGVAFVAVGVIELVLEEEAVEVVEVVEVVDVIEEDDVVDDSEGADAVCGVGANEDDEPPLDDESRRYGEDGRRVRASGWLMMPVLSVLSDGMVGRVWMPRLGELFRSCRLGWSESWMTETRVGDEGKTSSTRLFFGVRMVKAGGRWPSVGLDVRGSVKNCR